MTNNFAALIFSRFTTGFFGIFMSVFAPVWVDYHGKSKVFGKLIYSLLYGLHGSRLLLH
jgi:hypothetical protein